MCGEGKVSECCMYVDVGKISIISNSAVITQPRDPDPISHHTLGEMLEPSPTYSWCGPHDPAAALLASYSAVMNRDHLIRLGMEE